MTGLPTTDQIESLAEVSARSDEYAFACWHPQWGGYVGRCVVTFGRTVYPGDRDPTPGCFDVANWHDGEFPRDDEAPTVYHYCDAAQLIDFGITVLEKQREHQAARDGSSVVMPESLLELRDRLDALIAGGE